MWARVVETLLGVWLLLSPFIFGHYPDNRPLWLSDITCGGLVIVLALLSIWHPARYVHLLILGVAAWLALFAYFAGGYPAAPGYQNEILVGLTLLFFAIVPNNAERPSPDWRRYYQDKAERRLR